MPTTKPRDRREYFRAYYQARKEQRARPKVVGHCPICGWPFEATPRRVYCSNACSAKAYRLRARTYRAHQKEIGK